MRKYKIEVITAAWRWQHELHAQNVQEAVTNAMAIIEDAFCCEAEIDCSEGMMNLIDWVPESEWHWFINGKRVHIEDHEDLGLSVDEQTTFVEPEPVMVTQIN